MFYDFIDMLVKYAEWLLMFKLLVVWLLDLISDLRQFRSNVAFILGQWLQVHTFKFSKIQKGFKFQCLYSCVKHEIIFFRSGWNKNAQILPFW